MRFKKASSISAIPTVLASVFGAVGVPVQANSVQKKEIGSFEYYSEARKQTNKIILWDDGTATMGPYQFSSEWFFDEDKNGVRNGYKEELMADAFNEQVRENLTKVFQSSLEVRNAYQKLQESEKMSELDRTKYEADLNDYKTKVRGLETEVTNLNQQLSQKTNSAGKLETTAKPEEKASAAPFDNWEMMERDFRIFVSAPVQPTAQLNVKTDDEKLAQLANEPLRNENTMELHLPDAEPLAATETYSQPPATKEYTQGDLVYGDYLEQARQQQKLEEELRATYARISVPENPIEVSEAKTPEGKTVEMIPAQAPVTATVYEEGNPKGTKVVTNTYTPNLQKEGKFHMGLSVGGDFSLERLAAGLNVGVIFFAPESPVNIGIWGSYNKGFKDVSNTEKTPESPFGAYSENTKSATDFQKWEAGIALCFGNKNIKGALGGGIGTWRWLAGDISKTTGPLGTNENSASDVINNLSAKAYAGLNIGLGKEKKIRLEIDGGVEGILTGSDKLIEYIKDARLITPYAGVKVTFPVIDYHKTNK